MKTVQAGLIVGCTLVMNLIMATTVDAVAIWDIADSKPAPFNTSAFCPVSRQYAVVKGFSQRQEMCQFSGERLNVATYFADGGEPRLAVSHPFDKEFRAVDGVCQGTAGCLYSPNQDLLVVKYPATRFQNGVKIFRNASQRLSLSIKGMTYRFDDSQPEYVLNNSSGIGAVGISRNGKWLVAEIKNRGVMLTNLQTLTERQAMSTGVQYGLGKDPKYELAVSNDGRYVAAVGEGAGFALVEMTDSCGLENEVCPMVGGSVTRFTSSFLFAEHPQFDESGKQVNFYVASTNEGSRQIIMRQPGYIPVGLSYLALGDSFTSGEGETDDKYYRVGTNEPDERCHVSQRSYPFLLGSYMNLQGGAVQSVACAGAKTIDVIGGITYLGQGQRLGSSRTNPLSDFERSLAQTDALETFQPGRIYQATFAEQYHPKVITIGIGGNDAGLIGKLKTCAMPDLCEWAADPTMRQRTGLEIQYLLDQLQVFFGNLLDDTPESLVYVVGYPQIIDPDGVCGPVTTTLLTYAERVFMKQSVSYLNQVIKIAAQNVGIPYLDSEHSFDGRQLCSGTLFPKAVNGLRLGDDLAITGKLPMLKLIGNESFHPTPIGHELIARRLWESYGDLRIRRSCDQCYQGEEAPPLPEYWTKGSGMDDNTRQSHADFIGTEYLSPSASILHINLPPGSIEPNSKVRIEIHSDPHMLGEFVAHADGSIVGEINLPSDLEEGYHVVHIYGASYARDPIDLYDFISYGVLLGVPDTQGAVTVTDFMKDRSVLGVATQLGLKANVPHEPHRLFIRKSVPTTLVILGVMVVIIVGIIVGILIVMRRRRANSFQDPGG